MKKALYLIMKNSQKALQTLEDLKESGFNATVINTESLHHAIDYDPRDHYFFSLRQLEKDEMLESSLSLFVLDEDEIERAKSIIRKGTNHFSDVRGFMFVSALEDFEGNI